MKVAPPKPASITVNDATAVNSQFTVSWSGSAGANNYTLRKRRQNSDGSWGGWSYETVSGTSRAYGYRTLSEGYWQFQVRANATGAGSSSETER